jgi:hypothetical protein
MEKLKGKLEIWLEKVMGWFEKKSPFVQALLATVAIIVGISLFLVISVSTVVVFWKVFGWGNLLLIPILWLFGWLWSEFYDKRTRGY